MAAFNSVRFRIKPGRETEFLDAHKGVGGDWPGLVHANILKTGERDYCVLGEWDDYDSIVKARPAMIRSLDGMRSMLEDLGGDLGVTDPVSGEATAEYDVRATKH